MLKQVVKFFNSYGTIASVQKLGRNIKANQVEVNKAVVDALETVVKWVAKLLPLVSLP
jgi:hypothetical protein